MASNITLVITSCDRHDLLKVTIDSFIATMDAPPQATIIVEDSHAPMPEWLRENIHEYAARIGKITWVQNEGRHGQVYSIDRAYELVKTDYIFHCEDDWQFVERNYLRDSKALLDKYPKIIQVSLRGDTGWHQLIDLPGYEGCKIAMPGWHGHWGGISWNPGLRRLSDYKKIGSYGRHVAYGRHGLGHEAELSQLCLDMGYRIADLNRVIVVHTGGSRSRSVEPLDLVMPKILIAVPACHKFEYGRWESEQSPHYDPAKAWNGVPYGKDIHISGKNDRIDAVRDTWAKDTEPFKEHVTLKFFYGTPHNREPLPDEVFLPCPDDYEHLPDKTREICRWAVDNGYDYLLKVDDDTIVYVDRAIHELMTNRLDYGGNAHHGVCTGGPGYWLSRRAMKHVVQMGLQGHWAEDVTVAKIMTNANIYPVALDGHRSGSTEHWFFGEKFDPVKVQQHLVTAHAVQPDVMREWHKHLGGKK